jgi:hypothetical protein
MVISIFAFAPLALLVLRFHWLGLPGVWAALGCWMAARTVLLGRRWAGAIDDRPSLAVGAGQIKSSYAALSIADRRDFPVPVRKVTLAAAVPFTIRSKSFSSRTGRGFP